MTSQTSSDFLFNAMNIDNLDGLESSGNIKLEVDESTDLLLGNKRKLEVKTEPYQVSENPDDFSIPEPQRKKIRLDTETNINNTTDINQNSNGNDGNNGNNNNNNDNINDSKSNGNSVFTFQDPPKINTNVNNTMSNINTNNNNNNHHYPQQPPTYSTPTSYLLPVVPQPSSYFVPVVPHHLNPHFSPHLHHAHHPINHGYPSPFHHHPHYPQYIPHYNGYHHPHSQPISVKNLVDSKKSLTKRRKRMFARNKKPKIETKDENIIDELNQDNNNDNNNTNNNNNGNNNSSTSKLINSDKSPFKTTYISHDEEVELKNTNSTLYSQFHHARQAIYNQYQQKVDAIRHSPSLNPEKRKLQIKIAAIDAKVQEKKLFLSYLEMSKPQPNSWLISNTALSMNPFARKITKQQQTPSSYNIQQQQQLQQTGNNDNTNNNTNDDKKENGKKTTAKRVKKPKFSEYNVRVLRDWYETHTSNPYPSSAEKHLMCQLTGLTKYQVSRWFCNVRTRKPPPELSDNDEDLTINNNGTIIVDSNGDNVNVVNNSTIPNSPHLTHHYQQSVIPPPPPPINMHTPSNINMSNMNMVTPMNINHHHHMPPITPIPITPQHNFNFTAMNLPPNLPPITPINAGNNNIQQQNNNNNNINQNNNNQNQLQKENMIDQSENTEGLMPPINSNFINNPPPLIDENSNHMSLKNNCNEN